MIRFKQMVYGNTIAGSPGETVYTAPVTANATAIIKKMTLTNFDSSDHSVTISLVVSGGSADDANAIVRAKSVPLGETVEVTEVENHILESGGFIFAVADTADKVTMFCSGIESL